MSNEGIKELHKIIEDVKIANDSWLISSNVFVSGLYLYGNPLGA